MSSVLMMMNMVTHGYANRSISNMHRDSSSSDLLSAVCFLLPPAAPKTGDGLSTARWHCCAQTKRMHTYTALLVV